jgi:hypothetical protein
MMARFGQRENDDPGYPPASEACGFAYPETAARKDRAEDPTGKPRLTTGTRANADGQVI